MTGGETLTDSFGCTTVLLCTEARLVVTADGGVYVVVAADCAKNCTVWVVGGS